MNEKKKNKFILVLSSIGSAILAFILFIFHFKNSGKKEEQKLYKDVKQSSNEVKETIKGAQESATKIEEASKNTLDILSKYDI